MRLFLQTVFALAILGSISACTQTLNDAGVWMDGARKSSIGR